MSIGIISILTPLEERIDRWATSGLATRILLHPEDYKTLSKGEIEKIEGKYNLPIEILGGERALALHLREGKSDEEEELVAVDLSEVLGE
jgi:hypothetical protein